MSGVPDVRIGTRLGQYRLDSRLGAGGMGVVYLATDEVLQRRVAVKVLAPERAADPVFRERFLREARSVASLRHRNIVTVYGAGEADGDLYLAMEYVDGRELRTWIEATGALTPSEAVAIVAQVADALDTAHAAGLVHRDVKPGNILVVPEGDGPHAYLVDFGLARPMAGAAAGALTSAGEVVGTPGFVAPEQLEAGGVVDGRTDVYALGCVLFSALTGSMPYPRDSTLAVLWAHKTEPPPLASERRPDLAPFDPVIARAMARRPADRYPQAGELAAAARSALIEVTRARTGSLGGDTIVDRMRPEWRQPGGEPASVPGTTAGGTPGDSGGLGVGGGGGRVPSRSGSRAVLSIAIAIAILVLAAGALAALAIPEVGRGPGPVALRTADPTLRPTPTLAPGTRAPTAAPATATTSPQRTPAPDLGTLTYQRIPPSIRSSCSYTESSGWWTCAAGALYVYYTTFESLDAMQTAWGAALTKWDVAPDSGACKDTLPAEGPWHEGSDSTTLGRIACDYDGTNYWFNWTDDAKLMRVAIAAGDRTSGYSAWTSGDYDPLPDPQP